MNKAIKLVSMGALFASVTLLSAGHARAGDSGFLGDYSALSEVTDAAGDKVMRYVNPNLKPGAYQAVMIDPTQYYPAPKPTQQVTASTLTDIGNYLDKGLHAQLGAKLKLVYEPGPGVLRMKPAITAVASEKAALKPYQYIPIAFVFASVGRAKEASIQVEVDIVDSLTGERMGAMVRQGAGAKLPDTSDAQITLTDVMPLLNKWIDTGSTFLAEQMK